MTRRDIGLALLASVVAAGLAIAAPADYLRGLSLDTLYPLLRAARPAAAPAGAVSVVAVDEETYRRQPFAGLPQAAWTPLLAPVLKAVTAEASVIGFDIVYPTSLEAIQRGFDREFLIALRDAARQGKLVLGKVQHAQDPLVPHPAQQIAVGGNANIRALNLHEDSDGIIRRVPVQFAAQNGYEPSLAGELAARHLKAPITSDGAMLRLGERKLASDGNGNILVNFDTGAGAVPAHSLADLHACAAAGRSDYFERHFRGRVVIFAAILDVEDRRLTSKRLATLPEGANDAPRCSLDPLPLHRADFARDSIPGGYIHAAAVNNLVTGGELREWPDGLLFGLAVLLAAPLGLAACRWSIGRTVLLGAGAMAGLPIAATALALHGLVFLPWINLALAIVLTLAALIVVRFALIDREKRRIGQLFSLYLPAAVISRMMKAGGTPSLGGEEREVTVLFSDIAGFTGISETCSPPELVDALNTYFSAMTDIVESHGGFVDKYIGDAIVAVFGAPVEDKRHADHAIRAAMHMRDLLAKMPERFSVAGRPFKTRIGINSGPVLIGNIGSPRRFNYTVIGDTVNLAARLEGANKAYGTSILVSEAAMRQARDVVSREIDLVKVVGRGEPVRIFEPLARSRRADARQVALSEAFDKAQAARRQGDIDAARRVLADFTDDPAARLLLTRLAQSAAGKVTELTEK